MVHIQELIQNPKVKANLEEIAKTRIIETLDSQIKDILKRIEWRKTELENETNEEIYKMYYANLYTLNYERDWLLSKKYDLENN
jgi:hypothetical protein